MATYTSVSSGKSLRGICRSESLQQSLTKLVGTRQRPPTCLMDGKGRHQFEALHDSMFFTAS
jgi:hypothetical protein